MSKIEFCQNLYIQKNLKTKTTDNGKACFNVLFSRIDYVFKMTWVPLVEIG